MFGNLPYLLFLLLFGSSCTALAQNAIDSLKLELSGVQQGERELILLSQLSEEYLKIDPDSALFYANKSVTLATKGKSKIALAKALRDRANAVAGQGDDARAIAIYKEILELKLPEKERPLMANINRQMGNAYYHLAHYDSALIVFFKALELFEKDSLKEDMAGVLNNIGNVYYFTNMNEAAVYYERSLNVYRKNGNYEGIASQLGNLGLVYINTKEYDRAIRYCEESLQRYKTLGYQRSIARSQVNLAYAYKEVGKTSLALFHARESLELRKKLNDVRGIATSTIMIGNIYFALEDYGSAIPYFEKGLKMTRELGMRSYEWEVMTYLAECFAKEGRTAEALSLYPEVIAIKDSIYRQESQAMIAEMETKYETIQKEGKIKLLTTEAELADLQLRKRETYLFSAVIVTFLLGIISLILYFFYRVRTKANSILARKNDEISAKNVVIEEKNRHITDSIRYAERLQAAILPKDESFAKHFKDFLILYKPKDIVSGDFYWMEEAHGSIFLVAADCTGHGVPGAMVSMVGFQGLNKAVLEERISSPAAILQRLSDHVEEAFGKSGGSVKDGMDICLVAIDLKKRRVTYAGAHNALWILSSKEELPKANLREEENGKRMFELKADRRSIGGFMDAGAFTEKQVELNEGDRLFLFSDGFADQFGGPQGKKLGSKRMRETIREMAVSGNLTALGAIFEDWKGDEEQIDDVTVISVMV